MVIFNEMIWVLVSILVYVAAQFIYTRFGRFALLHPLLISCLLVAAILSLSDVSISDYVSHTKSLQWMLLPATIALAVPLYLNLQLVKTLGWRVFIPIVAGGICAPLSALLFLFLVDTDPVIILSMMTKSITTPLAIVTSESIGGIPSLAAVFVIVTGMIGAILCPAIFAIFKIKSEISKGLALGTIAHAIGSAQAIQISDKTAAFASLALCINGILTAIALPILFLLLM